MEKFDYSNFGKFLDGIFSNPDVFKIRDLLAEKAYDWFDISSEDVRFIEKDSIVKDIYKYLSLCFYIAFKNNPEASKIDVMNIRNIESSFPEEVYFLKKNIENWQYFLTYYSGLIDGLSRCLAMKDGTPFKKVFESDPDDGDDEKGDGN